MKLTVDKITPYLPHKVKCIPIGNHRYLKGGLIEIIGLMTTNGYSDNSLVIVEEYENEYYLKDIQLALRPLSDLTKEIEVSGEKFVFSEWIIEHSSIGYDPIKELIKPLRKDVRWINHCKYYIIQYLLQFHFDIFDLIKNNLAIDINTLLEKKQE